MKISERKNAINNKSPHYFTGKPCIRGHISKRWTSSGKCQACHYEENTIKNIKNTTKEEQKAKARAKKWYLKNRSITIQRAKKWKEENREQFLTNERIKSKSWRRTEEGRLITFMRGCLRRTIKNKSDRTSSILGYTYKELKIHLEKQFVNGMSWDNHGEWHIDHIKPVTVFLREGEKDPSVINCLTNLQPLWAKENLSKNNKFEGLL